MTESPICMDCGGSNEHSGHEILPLEEASEKYKDQFHSYLELLREEREKILACQADAMRKSHNLLMVNRSERQKTVTTFSQLCTFLDKQEKLLLSRMEQVDKEAARKRVQYLAGLSEALSSLESIIQEMEKKCEQPPGDLLQDIQGTLQRYEKMEAYENQLTFPLELKWKIWNFYGLNPFLGDIMKQFKDTLGSGLHLPKAATVTLNPDTAHRGLILSVDQKSVRQGEKAQSVPDNPGRFESNSVVLGCEGFTAGCHFWEVLVGSEEEWAVGVAKQSVSRKGCIKFSPAEGVWAVGNSKGNSSGFYRSEDTSYFRLPLTRNLQRIRVCLNYDVGRVVFFNAETGALLHEFLGATFQAETLLPFFLVKSNGHLKLS